MRHDPLHEPMNSSRILILFAHPALHKSLVNRHLIAAADTPYRRHVIHWAASHRFFFSAVAPG